MGDGLMRVLWMTTGGGRCPFCSGKWKSDLRKHLEKVHADKKPPGLPE